MPIYRRRVERAEFIEVHADTPEPWPENVRPTKRRPFIAEACTGGMPRYIRDGDFLELREGSVVDVLRPRDFFAQWEPEPETA